MPKREYDPLTHLPSPSVVREHLQQTERLAKRLRILLQVTEDIHRTEEKASPRQGEYSLHAELRVYWPKGGQCVSWCGVLPFMPANGMKLVFGLWDSGDVAAMEVSELEWNVPSNRFDCLLDDESREEYTYEKEEDAREAVAALEKMGFVKS